ncbi:MAG: fused MFS/spermidine synthase [Candidatus Eremiobacteraeota bacterium]|nr:fused MFS/spermidine synthase [Candidatus Eremiobacteraeota bacterium]
MGFFYVVLIFICGMAVMIVEVLGTRLVAPFYGASLYVWAALILVTLVGLALGYWFGGMFADRSPRLPVLLGIIAFAGFFILLLPFIHKGILLFFGAWGLELGSLFSALVLFIPPMLLLGMVSPFCVKLLSSGEEHLGLTVGSIYGLSTVGGVIGVLLSTFVLIPLVGVRKVFVVVSIFLLLLSLVGWIITRRSAGIVTALILLVAGGFAFSYHAPVPASDRITLVDKVDSPYGELKILDMGRNRCLMMDGVMQTASFKDRKVKPGDGLKHRYNMELLPYFNPRGRTALLVGLGGGLLVDLLSPYGFEFEMVEIDPRVVELARRYFDFDRDCAVGDGRYYLKTRNRKYDFVLLDALQGESLSSYLFTVEMFELARSKLKPGGILAINSLGIPGKSKISDVIANTLSEVFPHVIYYRSLEADKPQLVTFFASMEPLSLDDAEKYAKEKHVDFAPFETFGELLAMVKTRRVPFAPDSSVIITDDYNPLEGEWAKLSFLWRQETRKVFNDKFLYY